VTPERFGRFVLEERLAEGGMAEVFRAVSEGAAGVQKVVALKRVLPALGGIPEFVTMFIDEARIASRLTHVNIAQVFEFGEVDGVYFLVLELVEGVDLGRLLAAGRKLGRRMPPALAAFIGAEVARGLAYAHAQIGPDGNPLGLVHRDVSPQNVLLSYAGEVKLADFGIAKAAGKLHKTESGAVMGKLRYMSPEQVMGTPLDGRSDVFALGAVLWEALTGRVLFNGQHPGQVADQIKHAEVPTVMSLLPEAPAALDAVLGAALALQPTFRPTAAELGRALGELAGTGVGREDLASLMRDWVGSAAARSPAVFAPTESAKRATAYERPRPGSSLPATALVLALLGGGAAAAYFWKPWQLVVGVASMDAGRAVDPVVDAGVSDGGRSQAELAFEVLPRAEVAWRGVATADYLALLSSVDAALGGRDDRSDEVARLRLEPVRDALVAYVRTSGGLPPRVAAALRSFLRERPAYSPGAEGWSLARLAILVEPTASRHFVDMLRQQIEKPETVDGGTPYSRAATVRRLAVLDGVRGEALLRYLDAPAVETPVDVDGLRYQILGAVRDEAAATIEVRLKVVNLGAAPRAISLHHLRLAELERGPTVEPALDTLAAGQTAEARLGFAEVTDRVAEATSLTLPNGRFLAVYSELLP